MRLPAIPASFFGMVLGLSGLGVAWRAAHRVWGLPAAIGETLMALAALVWLAVSVLYVLKWVFRREAARQELDHPVQCCFVGLMGVATMLVGGAAQQPYSAAVALVLFALGAAFTLGFALWRTGGLWRGGRDHAHSTPVLYLPAVAGSYVVAAVAGGLGFTDWGQIAFGAGLFSWLAIESVLLHRLITLDSLPAPMRPLLGIQLAPAPVGAVAYLSVTNGPPDVFAHAMIGYGLLQALIVIRLLPWLRQAPFAPSYWAYTFGVAALSVAPLRLLERGDGGAIGILAPILFVGANLVVGLVAIGTLRLAVAGRLLPKAEPASTAPTVANGEVVTAGSTGR
ncbi:dicarboxylate transporter/tellurite-resistance protein TehA [Rhizobiales bacterium Sp-1]|uniref:Dicarboxylate transporter/tellurite-resistance protein TehA n=1 Tax=Segnochrobactrum spirostomi TaxID=2608987 RepID=A0A6A7YAR9_9HYPH|nr:dicarboxylate transporter/tellurite-resistance protein TehA [Segnochrobactrum spirostomi]MQT15108.1 dicarboxylate transporter/tellurite-resistance protein TehA [Segnochrobactrum spirostomi]